MQAQGVWDVPRNLPSPMIVYRKLSTRPLSFSLWQSKDKCKALEFWNYGIRSSDCRALLFPSKRGWNPAARHVYSQQCVMLNSCLSRTKARHLQNVPSSTGMRLCRATESKTSEGSVDFMSPEIRRAGVFLKDSFRMPSLHRGVGFLQQWSLMVRVKRAPAFIRTNLWRASFFCPPLDKSSAVRFHEAAS